MMFEANHSLGDLEARNQKRMSQNTSWDEKIIEEQKFQEDPPPTLLRGEWLNVEIQQLSTTPN